MITFEARQADGKLTEYLVSKTTFLGAEASSPVRLPSAAGRRALQLTIQDDHATVADVASLSGVFVNGSRVVRYGPLRVDDRIEIGGCELRVKSIGEVLPPEPVTLRMHAMPAPAPVPASMPGPAGGGHWGMVEMRVEPSLHAAGVADGESQHMLMSDAARAHQQALAGAAEALHSELIKALDLRRQDVTRMGDGELRLVASKLIRELISLHPLPEGIEAEELAKFVLDEAVGLGVLESLMGDETVTEVMVNGVNDIFVERDGQVRRSSIAFSSEKALLGVIERIVSPIGRRVDESSPLCDARLKDGSRVNIVISPIALKGPTITIRKFAKRRLDVGDLVKFGSVDAAMVKFLDVCVKQKKNVVISGGTGSGKTTFLNILSNLIPPLERIVTIEDAAELKLYHDNLVTLEARPANVENRGHVTIRDLVRNALRMRPDRIIVGECRGGEALDMLQAMNTGHDGSLTTAHANSPRDMLSRLEVMVMMGGMDLPVAAIREQVASAVQIIVQQTRFPCGTRKVTSITEITGMERGVVQMQEIFRFQRHGFYSNGKVRGEFMPCGYIPTFYEEMREFGIEVDLSIFTKPAPVGAAKLEKVGNV